jgi:hypothetical protein
MMSSTGFIFRLCGWLFACSLLYGLLLAAGIGYLWTAPLVLLAGWCCFRRCDLPVDAPQPTGRTSLPAALLLLAGLLLALHGATTDWNPHGHWDAWWFWNPRAAYLTDAQEWRQAFRGEQYGTPFTVPVAHSDYPPFLPLLNALCRSWLQSSSDLVPYAISMLALLLCCSLLFLELLRRHLLVGTAALLFLGSQVHFVKLGAAQIADCWMALFVLMAVVAGRAAAHRESFWTPAGLALGLALWMKNEGMLILLCFLLVNAGSLLRNRRSILLLGKGLVVPLLAWGLFKGLLAPANDIVQGAETGLAARLLASERYLEIWQLTRRQIELYYPALPWLLAAFALCCLLRRRGPGRYGWMLLLIWAGYCGIYLISPHDLGWHINTSADRLVAQLYPTLLFLLGEGLADVWTILRSRFAPGPRRLWKPRPEDQNAPG